MCTVSVKVDEALLRGIHPELNSAAAFRQWAQKQIDMSLLKMTMEHRPNESQKDLWRTIEQNGDLLLKPSEIVDDGGEAIDLETFRADLYRMIDEVYAEP